MMLIIGLGNPGARYEFTRHNIGFLAVDCIADKTDIPLNKKSYNAVWGKGKISENDAAIAKPLAFMNLSGEAVKSLADFFCIETKDIIVIYDDVDLDFGTVRIKKRGGSSGHRGMESIIEKLGTNDFTRIRLGIGRPKDRGQGVKGSRRYY
ncbi:MAG: aminoacyl-tRNA hydrolase [Deltaproteobacteria bacterium]|nr:aminoacyl-tRNA hydrolase [Deltaproteobacteria bacterium]